MRTVRARAVVFAASLLALSALSISAQTMSRQADYRILLRSREFTPAPGLEARLAREGDVAGGHLLVQFRALPDLDDARALESEGVVLLDYVPNMSYFAYVTPGAAAVLAADVPETVGRPARQQIQGAPGLGDDRPSAQDGTPLAVPQAGFLAAP